MTRLFINLLIFLLLGQMLFSCQKDRYKKYSINEPQNFTEIFEIYWNGMNQNYVFWDIDKTDWDGVYKKYRPLFINLKLSEKSDCIKAVQYFQEITSTLIDCHYTIDFTFPGITPTSFSPSKARKLMDNNFHSPNIYIGIDSNYYKEGFQAGYYLTRSNERIFAASGTIDSNILYFSCNQFALKEAYNDNSPNKVKDALTFFFNQIKNANTNLKGIIIDLRNNPGGNIEDLDFFLGSMISDDIAFGYHRYKNGSNRFDYTPWIESNVKSKGAINVSVPTVVLIDNYTISLSEIMAMAIRTLPKSLVIGERTWGATGPLGDNEIFNGGSFTVGKYLTINTSSAEFKYKNNINYENVGFAPDIFVPADPNLIAKGVDIQLETAILQLNNTYAIRLH